MIFPPNLSTQITPIVQLPTADINKPRHIENDRVDKNKIQTANNRFKLRHQLTSSLSPNIITGILSISYTSVIPYIYNPTPSAVN